MTADRRKMRGYAVESQLKRRALYTRNLLLPDTAWSARITQRQAGACSMVFNSSKGMDIPTWVVAKGEVDFASQKMSHSVHCASLLLWPARQAWTHNTLPRVAKQPGQSLGIARFNTFPAGFPYGWDESSIPWVESWNFVNICLRGGTQNFQYRSARDWSFAESRLP